VPGQPVVLGPYAGGINTLSDPSAIADNELVDCVNLEIDLDGSLHNRPPWSNDATVDSTAQTLIADRLLYLGIFVLSSGTHRIGSTVAKTVKYTSGAWSLLRATTTSKAAVQYNNKIWVVSDNGSGPGFSFDGTTVTDVTTMPKGDCGVIYKERLWVGAGASQGVLGSTKLSWSKASDPSDWTTTGAAGTGSLDVGLGDGDPITNLVVYNENLIIFKSDSTWVFTYDDDPRLGTLRKISSSIGASTYMCVGQYQNALYVQHEGQVWELINYNYSPLSTKVPFTFDASVPVGTVAVESQFVSVVGDRLVCRFYNMVYVYNFITKAWTRWESATNFGPIVKDTVDISANGYLVYHAGSYVNPNAHGYTFNDALNSSDTETYTCSLTTKIYSIAEQSRFKRLFWWGADLIGRNVVDASVTPIVGTLAVTWQDVLNLGTWGDVDGNLWANPTNAVLTTNSTIDLSNYSSTRRFIKLYQSLRFREVQFAFDTTVDGKTPAFRLFNFVAYIAAKEKVVELVS
jgi:hypothetical protein